jgi:RHS repeat-associated protein
MVENNNGTYEFAYAPTGTQPLAWLEGQTLAGVHLPLPGGAFAVYNGTGIFQYNHADWLGSARMFSTPTRTASMAMSYAPFGEGYASGIQDIQFTSYSSSFTVSGNESQGGTLDDFTFRRYSPVQGRWISPDPAGLGAVDPSNPQSWNRYAYVANKPLTYVDPLGLFMLCCQTSDGGDGGDGGDDGGGDDGSGDPSGGDPCFLYGIGCGSQPPEDPSGGSCSGDPLPSVPSGFVNVFGTGRSMGQFGTFGRSWAHAFGGTPAGGSSSKNGNNSCSRSNNTVNSNQPDPVAVQRNMQQAVGSSVAEGLCNGSGSAASTLAGWAASDAGVSGILALAGWAPGAAFMQTVSKVEGAGAFVLGGANQLACN